MFWWKIFGYTLGTVAAVGGGIGAHKLGGFDLSISSEEKGDGEISEVSVSIGESNVAEDQVSLYQDSDDVEIEQNDDLLEDNEYTETDYGEEVLENDDSNILPISTR